MSKFRTKNEEMDYFNNRLTDSIFIYLTDEGDTYHFKSTTWSGKCFSEVTINGEETLVSEVDRDFYPYMVEDPIDQVEIVDEKGVVLYYCLDCGHMEIVYTHDGENIIPNPHYDWD